jgi:type II secretory pathway pseudopilin PulG
VGNSRGDTIIEVLLAITVFSMVAVATITIMNQGTNAAQRALEITHVRQEIDAQAEALRAAQQAAAGGSVTAWSQIAQHSDTSQYNDDTHCPQSLGDVPGTFIMDARTGQPYTSNWLQDINLAASPPYAQVLYDTGVPQSYGLWIERTFTEGGNLPDLYTFTINGCWQGAGLDHPLKLETVVRLYDPGS